MLGISRVGGGCCCPCVSLPVPVSRFLLTRSSSSSLLFPISNGNSKFKWNFKDLCVYVLLCSSHRLGSAPHGLSGNRQDATRLFDRSLFLLRCFSEVGVVGEKKLILFILIPFFPCLIFAKEPQLEVKYFPVLTKALIS